MIQHLLVLLVKGYRLFISPSLGNTCRFEPSCSVFSQTAIEQHGAAAGVYLTLGRLARCHPWCQGGIDAVPAQKPKLFTRLMPQHFFKKPS